MSNAIICTHIVVLAVDICPCVQQDLDNLGPLTGVGRSSPKEWGVFLYTAPSAPALPPSAHIVVLGVH